MAYTAKLGVPDTRCHEPMGDHRGTMGCFWDGEKSEYQKLLTAAGTTPRCLLDGRGCNSPVLPVQGSPAEHVVSHHYPGSAEITHKLSGD
ncbi:TPA: hypothetical protein ACH3X2_011495 [Trebouxia sp. C0005]